MGGDPARPATDAPCTRRQQDLPNVMVQHCAGMNSRGSTMHGAPGTLCDRAPFPHSGAGGSPLPSIFVRVDFQICLRPRLVRRGVQLYFYFSSRAYAVTHWQDVGPCRLRSSGIFRMKTTSNGAETDLPLVVRNSNHYREVACSKPLRLRSNSAEVFCFQRSLAKMWFRTGDRTVVGSVPCH